LLPGGVLDAMLYWQGEIQVIITPINVLGRQTAALLARADVEITINGETTTPTNFLVSAMSYRRFTVPVDVEGY
jgi:hypothetical protein